jgi:D-alanyl-D-alanine carboxypeptidase/D-alanyl-D-alanine-endopeptidase (penicillin-binding protein 4)
VLWITVSALLVCVLAGGGLAAYRTGVFERDEPAPPFPVPGLRATPAVVLAPDDTAGAAPAAPALARVLEPLLADRRLGGSVAASVVDAETGQVLYARRADDLVAPASTNKIVTAAAVLATVGPDRRLVTTAVAGERPGDVVLVGGGDPTLAAGPRGAYPDSARLDLLAKEVRKAGPVRRVIVDSSLFGGPTVGPGWDDDIVRYGYGAPITALTVDGGRPDPRSPARDPEPDLLAGRAFARALGVRAVVRGTAPASADAAVLGTVQSPPMLAMVEHMLTTSDNVLAETLARQVALEKGQPATFAGAAAAARAAVTGLGLDASRYQPADASGLSRQNLLTTGLLTSVLTRTVVDPALRGVLSGLPVAAYSGTLARRFGAADDGAGRVRAKTGTLSGVSALSGVVLDTGGRQLAFAVVADGVPPGGNDSAELALDRIGAALAACGCR